MDSEIKKTEDSKNIFSPNVSRGDYLKEKRAVEMRRHNMNEAYMYLGVAFFALALYSFFFLFPQTKVYLDAPVKLAGITGEIDTYKNVVLPDLQDKRDLKKAAFDEEKQKEEDLVNTVFPGDIDKLNLVKMFEDFAAKAEQRYGTPFELTSIGFEKPETIDNYTILPFTINLSTSREHFERFLELIDISGRLDEKVPIRLMDISSINYTDLGTDPITGQHKGVKYSVKLNAYSRSSI
jgi:hypothetical protein